MHLLLIAYEYPPIESAHGLRWGYLIRELAHRGHSADVVTVDLGDRGSTTFEAPCVRVRRTFAGPFVGGARIARRTTARSDTVAGAPGAAPTLVERIYRATRGALDHALVPDVRTEWLPFGLRAARAAIDARRPDVLIASHEPGVDLAIAHRLRDRYALPMLADLGDPMLACYSPRWRRRVDAYFERRWLGAASVITVTTAATRDLLRQRLPDLSATPIEVIPQGFDSNAAAVVESGLFDESRLELLYTGTLYAGFRDPGTLLQALVHAPRARLTIVGNLDGIPAERLLSHPQVRYLGRRSHAWVRAAQRAADVLVNIGNVQDVQVPGKIFEYFGADRPILHLAQGVADPASSLLAERRRGVVARGEEASLAAALRQLDRPRRDLDAQFDLRASAVTDFSWSTLAAAMERSLETALGASAGAVPACGIAEQAAS